MLEKMIIILFFTFIIHAIDTLSYAVRLAGIKTEKLAIGFSMFNIIVILSRTANIIQAPLTAGLVDLGKATNQLQEVALQFRMIIGASSVGTILGIIAMPTFIILFIKAIKQMEISGSVPAVIKEAINPKNLKRIYKILTIPTFKTFRRIDRDEIPWKLLMLNVFATAIYTVGVLSSLYASLLSPKYSSIAMMSSGLINGFAMIAFTVFVDPKIALLTDQVIKGMKKEEEMKQTVIMMCLSRLAGTFVAQIILIPAAYWIKWMSPFFY